LDPVLRGIAIYVILLLLIRLAGKGSLSDARVTDLLLLLVIGEIIQQALADTAFSLAVPAVIIVVLFIAVRLVDHLGSRSARTNRPPERPVVLVENGKPLRGQMTKANVTDEDILTQAGESQGLSRMDQIRYAILEQSGGINIVPRPPA
jgi:uncharacterized membrane protein YcaP (DUF421 family)